MRIQKNDGFGSLHAKKPSFRFNLIEPKFELPKGITYQAVKGILAKFKNDADVYLGQGVHDKRKVWALSDGVEIVYHDSTDENFLTIADSLGEELVNKLANK